MLAGRRLLQSNKCCAGASALANAISGSSAALAAVGGSVNQIVAACDNIDGVSTNDLATLRTAVEAVLPIVATIDNAFYTNVLATLTGDLVATAGDNLQCHIVCLHAVRIM